ncbi:hypothetical protein [Methylocapsa acidiphila]|uniref:hypothetical protein n=1 Tax=Methylocapsa acidiphila TaxID=133552 RepID=UPI00040B0227|nr:hypothetical protein [Methylocapsa acidiphila]
MSTIIGNALRAGMALGLSIALMGAVSAPARAQDGGAVAAGIIGGMALGAIAGSAIASAPPPPPPPYYYEPVYAPPPPRCWLQPQQVWNGYAYVWTRVQVCN